MQLLLVRTNNVIFQTKKIKFLDSISSVCLLSKSYSHIPSLFMVFCDIFSIMMCVVNLESRSLQYSECHFDYCSDNVKHGYSASLV